MGHVENENGGGRSSGKKLRSVNQILIIFSLKHFLSFSAESETTFLTFTPNPPRIIRRCGVEEFPEVLNLCSTLNDRI